MYVTQGVRRTQVKGEWRTTREKRGGGGGTEGEKGHKGVSAAFQMHQENVEKHRLVDLGISQSTIAILHSRRAK